jgi:hypothetical protein
MEKITDIIIAVAILLGMWIFGCWMGVHHFRDEVKMVQRDTIVRYDTTRYSRLELVTNSNALKIPKIDVPKLAFLDVEKVDTIYKNNVMYLTYPRESYYTKAKDVEIWHSGIDSTIDSLNVVQKTQNITETILHKPSSWRFGCDVGVDYGDIGNRFVAPNLGAELFYNKIGIRAECGAAVPFANGQPSLPLLYWKVGVKYRFVGR